MHLAWLVCSAPACLPGPPRAFCADERSAELSAQGGISRSPDPDDGTTHLYPLGTGLAMALVARRRLYPPRPQCSPEVAEAPRPALRISSPRSPPFRRPSNHRGAQRRGKLSVDRAETFNPGVSRCAEHDARITLPAPPRHGGVKRLKI
jgi:hypothetical protein